MTGPQLTAADIMDLRLWAAKGHLHSSPDGTERIGVPYLVISASDGGLYLHSQGRVVAGQLRAEAMHALLWAERLEPGFCMMACDATLTIEECLRTPQERQEARRRFQAREAANRAAEAAQREQEARRRLQLKPKPTATLTLNDLL
jgi:hypothetical protein